MLLTHRGAVAGKGGLILEEQHCLVKRHDRTATSLPFGRALAGPAGQRKAPHVVHIVTKNGVIIQASCVRHLPDVELDLQSHRNQMNVLSLILYVLCVHKTYVLVHICL